MATTDPKPSEPKHHLPEETPNSSEPLKYKTWVLRVSIHCEGCKRKVKKILHNIEGVYTTNIDLRQQRVTVTGNVDSETLIKKLVKTGKHAELWPQTNNNSNNNNSKDKKQSKAKTKDNQQQQQQQQNESDQNSSNDETNNGSDKETQSTATTQEVKAQSNKESAVKLKENSKSPQPSAAATVTFVTGNQSQPPAERKVVGEREAAGVAENGGGGGGKKKKKKKGQKSGGNNAGASVVFNEGGAETAACDSTAGATNHGLPRQHEVHHYPSYVSQYYSPPVYGVSYSTAQPSGGYGAPHYYCYASPPRQYSSRHVSAAEMEHQPYDPELFAQSQPSNSFELFSDENPNGCSVM